MLIEACFWILSLETRALRYLSMIEYIAITEYANCSLLESHDE